MSSAVLYQPWWWWCNSWHCELTWKPCRTRWWPWRVWQTSVLETAETLRSSTPGTNIHMQHWIKSLYITTLHTSKIRVCFTLMQIVSLYPAESRHPLALNHIVILGSLIIWASDVFFVGNSMQYLLVVKPTDIRLDITYYFILFSQM